MAECFHCGLPVAAGVAYRARVLGAERVLCCAGCEAVAKTIVDAGFEQYYETRTAPARSPPEIRVVESDRPGAGKEEASLVLEGVRCAACLWLIESALRRAPGVAQADVHYATRRAHVRWDAARTGLPALLAAVRAVGYDAAPYEPGRQAAQERREERAALLRLFVAAFGAMQVMMYAFPEYTGEALAADAAALLRWAGLLITAPVLGFSCMPFLRGAWRELRSGRLGLETPIALGLGGAFAASAWATLTGQGAVYFDSVSMLAFLLLAARYGEAAVRRKASALLDPLLRLPAAKDLRVGSRILVAPGERIAADGVVLEGASAVDESLLTGESRPVPKRPGDPLLAGSANLHQPLAMQVERVGAHTRAAGIARLVERAAAQRPALVQAADRVARPLTAVVLAVALGALLLGRDPWIAVAVLVVTCPCALALASPVVLIRAGSTLLARGVLMTRSRVLQALGRVTDVLVDKTGTLTQGRLTVSRVVLLGGEPEQACLALAAALERASGHPIARAFPSTPLEAASPRYFAGRGVTGEIDGRAMRLGSEAFCRELCGAAPAHAPSADRTVAYLADARGWIAAFELEDPVRPDAAAFVAGLKMRGIRVHLLSGDRGAAAAALARRLGIERAQGDLQPQDKLAYIRALQAQGRVVAMVGDGLNDGPVLAAADASFALGSGADATQLQADAVLLKSSLGEVLETMRISGRAMRLIRQNIGWALAYNAIALPAAALGLVGPLEAALGMGASSLAVLLNALRPLDAQGAPWKASTSSSPSPSRSYT